MSPAELLWLVFYIISSDDFKKSKSRVHICKCAGASSYKMQSHCLLKWSQCGALS